MRKPKVLHTIFLTISQDLKRQIEEIPELYKVLNYKTILLKFVKSINVIRHNSTLIFN